MEEDQNGEGAVNYEVSCAVKEGTGIGNIAETYKNTAYAMKSDFAVKLVEAIRLSRQPIASLCEGTVNIPEVSKIWKESGAFLYEMLNEKGLKQIHDVSVQTITTDRQVVEDKTYPALADAAIELQGLLDDGLILLNMLTTVLKDNVSEGEIGNIQSNNN